MNYLINEAQFTLPDAEVQDTSINILKFAKLGTTLVVSRSPLADGESLQSNFEGQLKKLEQQVKDLRYSPAQAVKVGPAQDIDAYEVQNRFNKGSDNIYQYQLAMQVPGTRCLIALSYVKTQPLGTAEAGHWAMLKSTLNFLATS
ncbi:DcrB-related protein [Pseudomonas sp. FP2338]|uniref:DcrB-related protein n=1 Tax=Pseudomonas sp. FP2338 TaxID=2954093 RepID=UPI002733DE1A|nr:DcrB-related protein [Pseudomonas sp. FP2338]WLH84754.1 DcrB-related protein [Pseudomonas sp. FP2338]